MKKYFAEVGKSTALSIAKPTRTPVEHAKLFNINMSNSILVEGTDQTELRNIMQNIKTKFWKTPLVRVRGY